MPEIGFSTGALAKGEIAVGVRLARQLKVHAIELSALRVRELDNLLAFVATQDLTDFAYISVHAPTDYSAADEKHVAEVLGTMTIPRRWPVILHPDTVYNFEHWIPFGSYLYVENMDKRKPRGRTVEELQDVLTVVPQAHICFDIAHARQVDSSMTEAYRMLRHFRSRIRQMHFSEVGSDSRHRRVSDGALKAYADVAQFLPLDVPVILETVVAEGRAALGEASLEIERLLDFLSRSVQLQASTT
jgi:hypothetical protein